MLALVADVLVEVLANAIAKLRQGSMLLGRNIVVFRNLAVVKLDMQFPGLGIMPDAFDVAAYYALAFHSVSTQPLARARSVCGHRLHGSRISRRHGVAALRLWHGTRHCARRALLKAGMVLSVMHHFIEAGVVRCGYDVLFAHRFFSFA
jgi:hypothetical protein